MSRIQLLNTMVDNLTMQEAVHAIDQLIQTDFQSYVVTPNVDHIVRLEIDAEFKEIYENANLVLTDGKPLIWISRFIGNPIKEKVSGSDLFPKVCEMAAQRGYSIFLFGAAAGVANLAAANLQKKYKSINIIDTYSPEVGFENDRDELERIFTIIGNAKPDILVLGLGSPKQEKFFYKYKERLPVGVALSLGASIDFEAGIIKRAPLWMQNNGLEWLYRLCKEPRRLFYRYLIEDMRIFKIIYKYHKR